MQNPTAKLERILSKLNKILEQHIKVAEENEALKNKITELENKVGQLEKQHKSKLVAGTIGQNEEEKEIARKRINEFIREIDKCIAMLNN